MWGPTEPLQELRQERPLLIGNRRQGPDLAEVGGRRSTVWLKAHFYDPPEVSGASIMPSYAFLFRDERGDDLVSYLESLHGSDTPQHLISEGNWHPSSSAIATANAHDGERDFQRHCATCHEAGGRTRWKLTSRGFLQIFRLDLIFISHFQTILRSEGTVSLTLSNLVFPEPICPDMNTCPTTR